MNKERRQFQAKEFVLPLSQQQTRRNGEIPPKSGIFGESDKKNGGFDGQKQGFVAVFCHYITDLGINSAFFEKGGFFVQPAESCTPKTRKRVLFGVFFGKKRRVLAVFDVFFCVFAYEYAKHEKMPLVVRDAGMPSGDS